MLHSSEFCPSCGWGPLVHHEWRDKNFGYRLELCDICHFEADIQLFKLVHSSHRVLWTRPQYLLRGIRWSEMTAALQRLPKGNFGIEGRRIHWKGKFFTISKNQAEAIQILYENFIAGTPEVHGNEIMRRIGIPTSRLRDSFRAGRIQKLWGTLIVRGKTRGTYRLNLP